MPRKTVEALECCRCNYVWIARKDNPNPKVCASCKSAYWDTPKRAPKPKR